MGKGTRGARAPQGLPIGWLVGRVAVAVLVAVPVTVGSGCQREVYEITPDGQRVRVDEEAEAREKEKAEPRHHEAESAESGDTIVLDNGWRVRYVGIRAPRSGEAYFEESRRANEDLVVGRRVIIRYDRKHPNVVDGVHQCYVQVERTADELMAGGVNYDKSAYIFVNSTLVGVGAARVEDSGFDSLTRSQLLRLEENAKQRRIGIWQP